MPYCQVTCHLAYIGVHGSRDLNNPHRYSRISTAPPAAKRGYTEVQALMFVTPPALAGIVLYGQNDLVSDTPR